MIFFLVALEARDQLITGTLANSESESNSVPGYNALVIGSRAAYL